MEGGREEKRKEREKKGGIENCLEKLSMMKLICSLLAYI